MNIQIKTKTQKAHQSSLENNISSQSTSVIAEINSISNIGTLQAGDTNVQARSVEWLDLPNETYTHIFSYLNRRALSSINSVCSAWNGVVQQIRTSGTLDFVKELPMSHEDLIAAIRKCSNLNNSYTSMSLYRFKDFTYEQTKNSINGIHSKGYANLTKILVSSGQIAAFTTIQATLYPEADARKIKFLQDPREPYQVAIQNQIENMCQQISIQTTNADIMDLSPLTKGLLELQTIVDTCAFSTSKLKLLSIVDFEHIFNILKFSIVAGDLKLINYFFENGVDLSIQKHTQASGVLLHKAFNLSPEDYPKNFIQELVDLLLNQGADIEARDDKGRTVLFNCSGNQVGLLLDRGAHIEAKDHLGSTSLFEAIKHRNQAKAMLLLDRGANIEARDDLGHTALNKAIECGWHDLAIDLLLVRGANPEAIDLLGKPVFFSAVRRMSSYGLASFLDICPRLNLEAKDERAGRTALFESILWGCSDRTRVLLDRGANLEAKDNHGKTALHYAALLSKLEQLECLLNRGANLEAKDNDGNTPLLYIITTRPNQEVVEVLLQKGANLEAMNHKGETALSLARKYNHEAIISLLSEKKVMNR